MKLFLLAVFAFALFNPALPSAVAGDVKKIKPVKILWEEKAFSSDEAHDQAMEDSRQYVSKPICKEPIIARIGGLTLSMPRENTTFYTKDGQIFMQMQHRCDIKMLKFVKTISTSLYFLTAVKDGYDTQYTKQKSKIDEARTKKKITKLEGGIERIGNRDAYTYIMPQKIIPTFDGKTATFYCRKHALSEVASPELDAGHIGMVGICDTGYYYRPNLIVSYKAYGFGPEDEDEATQQKNAKQPTEVFIQKYARAVTKTLDSYIVRE